ncbi:UNVERIFIED_ORG: transglycosylase-like protein with SLT domain [Citrobacter freundii]
MSSSVNNMEMRKLLTIILLLLTSMAYSSDCFERAGRDYRIDPDLLRAISWKESSYRVEAIDLNPVSGFGSGLMQVDSQHFNELKNYGIKPEHLLTDPCMNIYTGAYYLAIAFKRWGYTWRAVGAYNAGFRETDAQEKKRQKYAQEIQAIYMDIKKNTPPK